MADIQKNDAFEYIETYINKHGCDLRDFIQYECNKNPEILQMSDVCHDQFCTLYDDVFRPSTTTKSKGNKLENLIEVLFDKAFPNIFEVKRNCRTSSNEIDLLISWKPAASRIGLTIDFEGLGNTFLCECKNYGGKVNVTYIGKFVSLMCYTDTHFGVLVAWEGVTGKGWSDGSGLIKKIALADKRYIVVITKSDLNEIYNKKSTLFELLKDKYQSLKNDISYKKFISKHEAEEELSLFKNICK